MKTQHLTAKVNIAVFIAGSVLALYAALGFYVVPAWVKSKLPTLIQQQTGRKAAVSSVRFDPFSLRLSLKGFALQEPDGRLFAGFDEFFIDINALQSIKQAMPVIDKIVLNKPVVRIAKNKDRTFNFNDLLKNKQDACAEPCRKDGAIFPVNIEKLSIVEGKLAWEDEHFASPEKETVYPLNITIENLSTQADKPAALRLSLQSGSGGKLDWQGFIGLNPLSSSGHIKLDDVPLTRIRALALQDFVPLYLQGHQLFEFDYQAHYIDSKPSLNINQGRFELRDFQLAETALDKALVKIPGFAVHGVGFNLESHQLTIASVAVNDADFKAWLTAEGILNYQSLLPAAKAPAEAGPAQKSPWNVKIDTIAVNNAGFSFEDKTLKKPVSLIVKPINFKLTSYTNKAGANLPFQLTAGINENGLIKFDGNTVIEPLAAQLDVNVKDINLENFQAYVDKFAKLDVIDGALAIDGKVSVAKSVADKLDVKFSGNTKIADLLTRDQLKNKDFIKWAGLTLNGVDIDLPANQYSAESLVIDKPYARVVIRKDKTVNFGDIMITDNSKVGNVVKNTQKPKFKLGKLQVIDGSSDFSDLSLILPFAAQIKSLDGGASGISSEQKSMIKVELKGTAYDLAPVDIKGEIMPYLGDYKVSLKFTGMPMPLISSYMVQFAGYKVEKGKMSLELDYKVADRELTASNNILIDRFELGEKVENPNAVSLPLELAVALMKDSEGKIKMHVPISGSLENPQFSVSHIVADALVNAISKVITSPFRALASLVGSEEDLSAINFAAGDAVLSKPEISKLDDLIKALKVRSVLKLEIKGAAFQDQDWPAVSDDALYDQLKRIKAAEINKQGDRKIRPEYVVISDQDYRRLMEQLFAEKLPLMVEKTLTGTLRLVASKADTNTDEFYAVAKQKLSAIIKPEEQRLKSLASERAQAIANYVVQKGGVANDRVFILDTVIDPEREGSGIVSLLSLTAD